VTINAFLVALNLYTDHKISWVGWIVFFWGIGIAFHVRETFFRGSSDYEEEYRGWKWRHKGNVSNLGPADQARSYLADNPNDFTGAVRMLHKRMHIDNDEARKIVRGVMGP
jgi:hypothetical protein